jgi:hypothetical protein
MLDHRLFPYPIQCRHLLPTPFYSSDDSSRYTTALRGRRIPRINVIGKPPPRHSTAPARLSTLRPHRSASVREPRNVLQPDSNLYESPNNCHSPRSNSTQDRDVRRASEPVESNTTSSSGGLHLMRCLLGAAFFGNYLRRARRPVVPGACRTRRCRSLPRSIAHLESKNLMPVACVLRR